MNIEGCRASLDCMTAQAAGQNQLVGHLPLAWPKFAGRVNGRGDRGGVFQIGEQTGPPLNVLHPLCG